MFPPSVDEWLPQRHLARYVVEVVEGLDLAEMVKAYRGSGSASYHPAMLLALLIYGYARCSRPPISRPQSRQFLLRGFESANGEWNPVTMSWNIRRMFALRDA